MAPHILAALLLHVDQPHITKQEILCAQYAAAAGLMVVGVTRETRAALSMIVAGTVRAIVTFVDPGGTLAVDIAAHGGQLHIVRPAARRDNLEDRVLGSGLDTQQIATLLQVSPEEVRRRRNLGRHK